MKKLLSIMCVLFLLATTFPVHVFANGSDIIYNDQTGMPDPVLYKAVLNVLGKKEGTFTKNEAAGITVLWTDSYKKPGVKTLKGIENLKELEELSLSYNELTTLSGIEGLTKLKELKVNDNQLISLKGIEGLTDLEILHAYSNKLVNLKGIEGLTKLKDLLVDSNKLVDITGIEVLRNLEVLDLGENQLTDVSGIENLTNLWYLGIGRNRLKRLPDLRKLKNLEWQNTYFGENQLTAETIITKSPSHLVKYDAWLKRELKRQNVVEKVRCKKPGAFKKITVKTRSIVGKARKNVYVSLKSGKKTIKKAKTDSNGVFRLKKLNLKKLGGKTLKLQVYYYNKKYKITWVLKEVTFTVKKC